MLPCVFRFIVGLNLGAHTYTLVGSFISMFLGLCLLLPFHFSASAQCMKTSEVVPDRRVPPLFILQVSSLTSSHAIT